MSRTIEDFWEKGYSPFEEFHTLTEEEKHKQREIGALKSKLVSMLSYEQNELLEELEYANKEFSLMLEKKIYVGALKTGICLVAESISCNLDETE